MNATISVGAQPKKVRKMLFIQHFTVLKKKLPIKSFSYLHVRTKFQVNAAIFSEARLEKGIFAAF